MKRVTASETRKNWFRLRNFSEAIAQDRRFAIDEAPLVPLIRAAVGLSWTRDPFDRLLAAHSEIRRVPLCTLDPTIQEHHRLLPREIAG